jgi:DNA-binding transcriptional ArsR family regulator
MNAEEKFIRITGLMCEPTRARMLWSLLDGRAYTASELALAADISPTSASNHLAKLLEAEIVKVEVQGRHRYFSFSSPEVAYAVEALANLATPQTTTLPKKEASPNGIRYCRTCYDHLAGYVGVQLADSLEQKGYIQKSGKIYQVSEPGWEFLAQVGITQADFTNPRRPLARQCLDWSERRPHIAGQLGAVLLEHMLQKGWFKKVQFSREMVVTSRGSRQLYELLGVVV